jgi:hypothetical protein
MYQIYAKSVKIPVVGVSPMRTMTSSATWQAINYRPAKKLHDEESIQSLTRIDSDHTGFNLLCGKLLRLWKWSAARTHVCAVYVCLLIPISPMDDCATHDEVYFTTSFYATKSMGRRLRSLGWLQPLNWLLCKREVDGDSMIDHFHNLWTHLSWEEPVVTLWR